MGEYPYLPFLSSSLPSRSFLSKTFSWNDKCYDDTIRSNDCKTKDDYNLAKAVKPVFLNLSDVALFTTNESELWREKWNWYMCKSGKTVYAKLKFDFYLLIG